MQEAGQSLASRFLPLASCLLLLASCSFPGGVRPSVKIGLVAPFEGRYRYVGYDVIYAVRLALHEANHDGGVAGYSVELAAYDDGGDPSMATEQARKLAADPAVVAAIGHFREETTGAALSAYTEAGIPLVAPVVLGPALAQGEATVYLPGPAVGEIAVEWLRRLDESELDRAALVTGGGPLGVALLERVALPVILLENKSWLEEIRASGVQVVFCDADPVTAGGVITTLREAGWEGTFMGGPELAAADFGAVAGAAAAGALFVTPYPFPQDAPGGAGFAAAYGAISHHAPPPGPLAIPAYQATWTLIESLEQDIAAHGEPTREGVSAALAALEHGAVTFYWYRIGADGIAQLEATRP